MQAFFPGEEGGRALAGVLSGRVQATGRLPVSLPRSAGAQPFSYLHPILGGSSEITSADATPVRPFGFGLSYTRFERRDLTVQPSVTAGDVFEATVRVRNVGERSGVDIVQLYGHDLVAQVTRPVAQLIGYARVAIEPGEEVVVHFRVPPTRLAFTGLRGERIVEPGALDLWVGTPTDTESTASIVVTGAEYVVTPADTRYVAVEIERTAPATLPS